MNHDKPTPTLELDGDGGIDQLESRLQARLCGHIRELRLHFSECGVVLRGFARTYYAKQLAQHALMAETKLPILANEIEVY